MNSENQHPHEPVLLEETVSALVTDKDGIYLDCTIGFGGHSSKILERINKTGKLYGIDFDPYALEYSNNRLSKLEGSFELFLSNYTELKNLLLSKNVEEVSGILFDLGISSYQVDSGYKGISYRTDSPLDMQLDEKTGINIKDFLYDSSEEEIANTIYNNSEEGNSRKIAKSITQNIRDDKMKTNLDLVNAIKEVTPERFLNKTLSRVFQSFRIIANNEFSNILNSIIQAMHLLKPKGRLAVITFHSIEDRLVKNIFRSFSRGNKSYLENMGCRISCECRKIIKILTKKPIRPNRHEITNNKRSRSAKLRIVERLIII